MFADAVQRVRFSKGMNIKQLATELGYDASYITRLENGSRDPSLAFLLRLLEIADERDRLEILCEIGFSELDPVAIDVHLAMRGESWSQQRKKAFRQTVHSLIRTAN
jgi:transcriptional regulator with XRE-family HTH domain